MFLTPDGAALFAARRKGTQKGGAWCQYEQMVPVKYYVEEDAGANDRGEGEGFGRGRRRSTGRGSTRQSQAMKRQNRRSWRRHRPALRRERAARCPRIAAKGMLPTSAPHPCRMTSWQRQGGRDASGNVSEKGRAGTTNSGWVTPLKQPGRILCELQRASRISTKLSRTTSERTKSCFFQNSSNSSRREGVEIVPAQYSFQQRSSSADWSSSSVVRR